MFLKSSMYWTVGQNGIATGTLVLKKSFSVRFLLAEVVITLLWEKSDRLVIVDIYS